MKVFDNVAFFSFKTQLIVQTHNTHLQFILKNCKNKTIIILIWKYCYITTQHDTIDMLTI